jgi:hypothetical protein
MLIAGGVSTTTSRQPWALSRSRSAGSSASVVAQNAGTSLARSFHQAASEPCGSLSTIATGPMPASSAWTARCPERVVLPEPPFCEQSATTCIEGPLSGPSGRCVGATGWRFAVRH